jgi:hypothetical protein
MPIELDEHRLGLAADQALRRQDLLDLGCADAKRQGAKRPVGCGVAIAAHDRHARLGQPELGANDVNDSLIARRQVIETHAVRGTVLPECIELRPGQCVGDRQPPAGRGHVVIDRRERAVGPAHAPPGRVQTAERLWRRHLMHQMEVHVEQGLTIVELMHDMRVPQTIQERLRL